MSIAWRLNTEQSQKWVILNHTSKYVFIPNEVTERRYMSTYRVSRGRILLKPSPAKTEPAKPGFISRLSKLSLLILLI